MRWIRDNRAPEALIRCLVVRRAAGQPLDYDETGAVEVDGASVSVRQAIREARLLDQGFLCAYTLKRIDADTCHNEHLEPRSVSKAEGRVEETLDYRNIVACYPKRESRGGCPYGATARGTRPLAVSPLEPGCETRLRFDRVTGRFEPADPDDADAKELVDEVLRLNHPALVEERRNALKMAGVVPGSRRTLGAAEARRLAESAVEFQRRGRLMPFCVAVAQAARTHADLIERRSRRIRGASRAD